MGRRAAVVSFAVAALLGACSKAPPAGRIRYLLDDAEDTTRRIALGEDGRPAFGLGSTLEDVGHLPAGDGSGTVPPSRRIRVEVTRPSAGSGGRTRSVDVVLVVGDALRTQRSVLAPQASAVTVGFEADDVGKPYRYALSIATSAMPAPTTRTLGPVAVERGMALAVSVGVRASRCMDVPATMLRIVAVEPARRTEMFRDVLDPTRFCDRWREVRLPLEAFAGRRVQLAFEAEPAVAADRDRPVEVVVGDPVLVPTPGRRGTVPNVVLVSFDTLAARHLGTYGHAAPTSPTLDRIAAEGTVFDYAVAHYPSTTASHMTMLSGLLPREHAVRGVLDRAAATVPMLAATLRRAGFLTAAVTEDGALLRSMGFDRGFHSYRERHGRGGGRSARWTLGAGADWLRRRPPEPFFLFLHTYETHEPYDPPAAYLRAVGSGPHAGADAPAERYDAEIRIADHALRRLRATLAEQGLLERSILVVTSDHGEAFGEHGEWRHGSMLFDEVMHVPLVLRGPRIPRGRRVPATVGLVDLVPTLLDLVGVPVPPGLHGRSLVPALAGEAPPPRSLVAELSGGIGPRGPARARDLRAVWLGHYKAILDVRTGAWRLFDLAVDPAESRNVAGRFPRVVADAARAVAAYEALPIRRGPAAAPAGAVVDPAAAARLRALGYVD